MKMMFYLTLNNINLYKRSKICLFAPVCCLPTELSIQFRSDVNTVETKNKSRNESYR